MKKLENVTFEVCLALIIFIFVIIKPFSNLDELWNFNVARGISNGLVPYRDISMVSTPLLGFLSAIPLKIFGQEMFFTRIFAVVLTLFCFILICKILKNLDIKRGMSNFIMLIFFLIIVDFVAMSYNILALLFVLEIILLDVKSVKEEKWKKLIVDFFIGVLAGLVICSKQSIGLIVTVITVLNPFFYIDTKSDIKVSLKKSAIRALGCFVPVIVLVIYLSINHAFRDFISYSISGIKTFSNSIPYGDLLKSKYFPVKIGCIVIPIVLGISIITNIVLKYLKRESNIFYILTVYSLAMFCIAFPISDSEHFVIAIIPSCFLIIFAIKKLINKFIKKDFRYVIEFFNIFSVILILSIALWLELTNNEALGQISKYDFAKHFKYINIPSGLNKSINEVDDFILSNEKNVYILDATAAVYMIPLDRYNKNYDMFCIGNLGDGGEDSIIEEIKREDAIYLIMKNEENVNWQNPTKVRSYIKENMELVGNISFFEIYQNKVNDNIEQISPIEDK